MSRVVRSQVLRPLQSIRRGLMVVAMAAGVCAPAVAQSNLNQPSAEQSERARLLGLLVYRTVTVHFEQTPAREAISTLKEATGVRIVGRWRDDAVGFGMDPDKSIVLDAVDQPALDVLEEVLAQCSGLDECTWQLRRGFVEVGTKERLSVPAARESRLYEIGDLMLEPPRFASDENPAMRDLYDQNNPQHRGKRVRRDGGGSRKLPLTIAVELVQEVCETVEPGRWDYGQPIDAPTGDDLAQPSGEMQHAVEPEAPGESPPATQPAPPPALAKPLQPRSRTGVPIWARIRVYRDQLIVVAPDFIHRQIGGYPEPIPPEATAPAALARPFQGGDE